MYIHLLVKWDTQSAYNLSQLFVKTAVIPCCNTGFSSLHLIIQRYTLQLQTRLANQSNCGQTKIESTLILAIWQTPKATYVYLSKNLNISFNFEYLNIDIPFM